MKISGRRIRRINKNAPKKRTNHDFNLDDDPFVFMEEDIDDLV